VIACQEKKPYWKIRPQKGWNPLDLLELWAYREVLWMLALRDIKLRYKQTALGVVWVILQPLLPGLIFAVIFGKFARLPSDGQPYLLFVFSGLIPWMLFSNMIQRSGGSLVTEARLITKVYFPRMLVPLASGVSVLVDLACLAALISAWLVSPVSESLTTVSVIVSGSKGLQSLLECWFARR